MKNSSPVSNSRWQMAHMKLRFISFTCCLLIFSHLKTHQLCFVLGHYTLTDPTSSCHGSILKIACPPTWYPCIRMGKNLKIQTSSSPRNFKVFHKVLLAGISDFVICKTSTWVLYLFIEPLKQIFYTTSKKSLLIKNLS